jgi:hypothetical protein
MARDGAPATLTLEDLVSAAGLDASLADTLAHEQVTVEMLMRASLPERREVLRAMNQSFGTLLCLNRVLDSYSRKGQADVDTVMDVTDAGGGSDDEHADLQRNAEGAETQQFRGEEEEAAEAEAKAAKAAEASEASGASEASEEECSTAGELAPAAFTLRVPAGTSPVLESQLRAAAMLLRGAQPHTLKSLQAVNASRHPPPPSSHFPEPRAHQLCPDLSRGRLCPPDKPLRLCRTVSRQRAAAARTLLLPQHSTRQPDLCRACVEC